MSTQDQDHLRMLSAEEIAAMNDEEAISDEEREALARIAGDVSDDDDGEGEAEETEGADEEPESDDDESQDEADDGTDDGDSVEDDVDEAEGDAGETPRPAVDGTAGYKAALPEDYQAQADGLAEKERELKARFRDGEIDFDEYEAQREGLSTEREALTSARIKAEISQEMQAQAASQQWQSNVTAFLNDVKAEGGFDYNNDKAKATDLDQFIRALAGMPEHADKSMRWFLDEADRRVRALHGVMDPTPKADGGKSKAAKVAEADARRKQDLSAVPPNLAHVPAGSGPDDINGEFANLDKLEGVALEDAVARLSAEQRERYLQT